MSATASLAEHFECVEDPRRGDVTYPLINFLAISLCAVIAGADDFVAIADFARTRKDWLATFLDMSDGVPSHDRFNHIFKHVKPEQFEAALLSWLSDMAEVTAGRIVAIDGKTLRGSYDKKSSKAAIHMVSAWAAENHLSLGSVVTDAKSNEITAIPELLRIIELSGALVTIDAMGCQVEIAETIVQEGADYCLMVKGNQPTLHEGVQAFFADHLEDDFARVKVRRYDSKDKGHGRVEERSYRICPVASDLPDAKRWRKLKAIGIAINNTTREGKDTIEVRYYILSRYVSAKRFAAAVRGHWSIENSLHWQLDVTFGEDGSRLRKGHSDVNFSTLRRTALALLKQETTAKVGVKNKRLRAAWDDAYRRKLLFQP